MALWYNTVVLGKALDTVVGQSSSWVDVRDLAVAHVKAIEQDAAGGERIIISSGMSPVPRDKTVSKFSQASSSGKIGVRKPNLIEIC
jgi:nucleoside-diphosphate-sugar epimerase